jgi:hypothetical protein
MQFLRAFDRETGRSLIPNEMVKYLDFELGEWHDQSMHRTLALLSDGTQLNFQTNPVTPFCRQSLDLVGGEDERCRTATG